MLGLSEYELIAKKLISTYRKRGGCINVSDDLIGDIIHSLAKADWQYDTLRSTMSIECYRRQQGIFAIRTYLFKQKLEKSKSFDWIARNHPICNENVVDDEVHIKTDNKSLLQFLIRNSRLTKLERSSIQSYLDGINKNPPAVYRAIEKMKKITRSKK